MLPAVACDTIWGGSLIRKACLLGRLESRDICIREWSQRFGQRAGVADWFLREACEFGVRSWQLSESLCFKASITQYDRATRNHFRHDHPFLLRHRPAHEVWDSCVTADPQVLGFPIHAGLEVDDIMTCGPLSLVRLYVDAVDVGGKSRNA